MYNKFKLIFVKKTSNVSDIHYLNMKRLMQATVNVSCAIKIR